MLSFNAARAELSSASINQQKAESLRLESNFKIFQTGRRTLKGQGVLGLGYRAKFNSLQSPAIRER
jgi:hypothetical protein